MPLKLYLLRHGQTAHSLAHAFCGSGSNPDLTPDGHEMAQKFAAHYQRVSWQAIYTSPLKRCLSTLTPLTETLKIKPELRENLKEIDYGKWEGLSTEQVEHDFHDDYIRWSADPAWNAPTAGETAVAIAARALNVVEEIKTNFTTGNILLVSHKATIRVIIAALLGIDLARFRTRLACPVCSVSLIEFQAQGPILHTLADRSHLDQRLRDLPGT